MKIMLLNALLWVISHLPVFCISDDKNFSTIKYCGKDSNKTPHYRISLFSIMLGEVIYYFISLDMDETKIKLGTHRNLYYKLKLSEIEGCVLPDMIIDKLMNRFREHIRQIRLCDLIIEKEKLLYHIQVEQSRKDRQLQKLNIYAVIVVAVPTVILPLITTFGSCRGIFSLSKFTLVLLGLFVYSYINVFLYVFSNVKISTIQKSSFRDLRKSLNKKYEIVAQYYYDWQCLRYSAELAVMYVLNLQFWLYFMLILSVLLAVSLMIY